MSPFVRIVAFCYARTPTCILVCVLRVENVLGVSMGMLPEGILRSKDVEAAGV
jgi:hypothetical protein